MAYKSLLTIASSPHGIPRAVDAAALLAQAHESHLECLAIGVDRSQLGYSYLGGGPVLFEVSMQRAQEESAENAKALADALKAQSPDLRWSSETAVSQLGALTELVSARARYADLVILPRPYGEGIGPEAEAVIEAALFDGMAPVLVIPDQGLAEAAPRRILVAWDQSREAMVAARRALPLLKRAEQVVITVVDPPAHGSERSDPGGRLCQFLTRHGVRAEVQVLARTLPRISDVLARQAQDIDADLMVMGAYGHSRLREAILGGATRDMLETSRLALFLAR